MGIVVTMHRSAFIVVVAIGLISFVIGMSAVTAIYDYVAPYWLYGKQRVKSEGIHVVENQRHRIYLSNNPKVPVPKTELKGLGFLCGVGRFVAVIGLFFILTRFAATLVRRYDEGLANEIRRVIGGRADGPSKEV